MSRSYEMTVKIRGAAPDRVEVIKKAAESEWAFDVWYPLDHPDDARNFAADGSGNLCSGEREEEFVERLSRAIWKANGAYCEVEVQVLCLDCLPYETHILDEGAYEELVGAPSDSPGPADEPSDAEPNNPVNLDAAGWGDVYERQSDVEGFIDHDHSMDG